MDIQIASNFERLIFDINNEDDVQTSEDMTNIKEIGNYVLDSKKLNKINENFLSVRMDEKETLEIISSVYKQFNVVLDPHTAIGYGAFDKHNLSGNNIVLGTAHPSKFPDAILRAIKTKVNLPSELTFILDEKESYDVIENDVEKVKQHIKDRL